MREGLNLSESGNLLKSAFSFFLSSCPTSSLLLFFVQLLMRGRAEIGKKRKMAAGNCPKEESLDARSSLYFMRDPAFCISRKERKMAESQGKETAKSGGVDYCQPERKRQIGVVG